MGINKDHLLVELFKLAGKIALFLEIM
ncbi:hypothetical protein KKC1_25180 [Calderihabitans maritimus]|uniref:Uncharacterized protein n=1 Tax=Calderihabitans maritimus TaxID=1246530 RepID=A0A1Z5HV47_9FIRM|nr:hypothetical protein KKC1_25180 [Calderihabitans maritimus]